MFSRHPEALRAMATWLVEQETEEVVMRYEERGPEVNKKSKQARAQKMIRELRRLGYRVEPTTPQPAMAT